MAKKHPTASIADASSSQCRAERIASQVEMEEGNLREALLQGANTAAIRHRLADLQTAQSDVLSTMELEDRRKIAAESAATDAIAATIAAEVVERVASTLDALQPPEAPNVH